jgi:PhoH-like ATPase
MEIIVKKIYVLDTSVLVYDPLSFKSFNDNIVIIPITVLEELDKLKKFFDETGKNARTVIRTLDGLLPNNKDLEKGIRLENNILLKIDHNTEEDKSLGTFLYGDNRILSCAIKLNKLNRTEKVILISKDIALRIRAKALGLSAEDYTKDRYKSADEIYNSVRELEINDEQTNEFYGNHSIEIDDNFIEKNELYANNILVLKSSKNDLLGYGRFRSNKKDIVEIKKHKNVFGISPKSSEQNFALDLLLDNTVNLVSLAGPSGTGKTLLSLAAGLHSVLESQEKRYDKLIIMKPIVSVGKDLGTLPGSKQEKLDPFLASFRDNLNFLIKNSSSKMNKNNKDGVDPYLSLMMEKGLIEMEALSYLRGRSLPNAFIIIDEVQNSSLHELKTMITRIGEGSKIVLLGDLKQIDNMQLDSANNALIHAIEKFKGYDMCGSVLLTKGERSPLATLASEIL